MLRLRIPHFPLHVLLRRAALAYLIVWVLSPPLAYGNNWRVLALLAMLLWFAIELRTPRSVLMRPNLPVLACVVFIVYSLAIELLVPDSTDINQHFQIWIMLFFLLVGESHQRAQRDETTFCFWMVLLVLPIWSFTTLRGLDTISADVARTISRSSAEAQALSEQGIGGFGFIYTSVLCLPFLTQLAFRPGADFSFRRARWKQRVSRLIIWCNFVLTGLLVMRAGYSIALILAAIAVISVLLIQSRRAIPFAMSTTLAGLLLFTTSIMLEPALKSLQSVTANTEYAAKVRDVRESLKGGENVGTVSGRTERYYRSFQMFLESPITGRLIFDGVGGHSSILDRYAQYGVGFGTLFLCLLGFVPFQSLRDQRVPIGLALGFLIVALGFPMMNTVFMSWGLILYVFSRGAFATITRQQDDMQRPSRDSKSMSDDHNRQTPWKP